MSVGRDIRAKDLVMRAAPVSGGLEPELLPESRQSVLAELGTRAASYTPEWTDRSPDDAGAAIVRVHAVLAVAAHTRLNRIPRRLALNYLQAAGVQALPASPAQALSAIEVADGVDQPLEVAEGSVFTTPAGLALETAHGCSALPGRIGAVAVLANGWLTLDRGEDLGGLPPFGPRPQPPAELWIGLDSAIAPAGILSIAVELTTPPGRAAASAAANRPAAERPLLRWEAISAAGPVELAVEFDESRGLDQSGVIAFRVPAGLGWPAGLRPGQTTGASLRWLRARLLTNTFRPEAQLSRLLPNGVGALAARSVRGEVAEPIERLATGGSTYRLAQAPVLPGSVVLDITEPGAVLGAADTTQRWQETTSLVPAQPDDRVFVLDPSDGTLTFGDGLHGRAVPEGYRNVVARSYRTGGGSDGLPRAGDLLPPELSVPDLTGLRIASMTTGSPAEPVASLLQRGPGEIRSRLRAVAAADYAVAALTTPGVDIARAYGLPGQDPVTGSPSPGTVGVIVVPRSAGAGGPPVPTAEVLQRVADHLARTAGVAGARVVTVAPRYREVAVQGLLVGVAGADLAAVPSLARDSIDRWLDPLAGGDGTGWAFGAPVRWNSLVRMLLAGVPDLEAASQVRFRVDGRPLPACAGVTLAPGELTWPGTHLLEAVQVEGGQAP
jgi:predicted phage baseplate assembly protein